MDSIYYVEEHGGYFGPWKANDGNRDPEMRKANNSCAHSEGGLTSHWWAVDLGVPLYVAGVLFTNRADEHGNLYTYSLNNVFMGTFYAHAPR